MNLKKLHLQVGIDTGGTFTDLVAWDGISFRTAKVPSTPPDFHRGVVTAIQSVLRDDEGVSLIHGSTVATNALLEHKGHPIAFVTTEGFRDLLLIGRQNRPLLYDLEPQRSPVIVVDEHVFTVAERIGFEGKILTPLSMDEVDRVADRIQSLGLKHVAVCLLFSFANPRHEQMIGDRFRSAGLTVTLSSELLPEFREYERGSTTAVNAALVPNVQHYLSQLSGALPAAVESLRIMHSGGGTLPPADAGRFAARLLLSGPAGGVLGAHYIAGQEGFTQTISYDMGGTSTDVAAMVGDKPPWTTGTIIAGHPVSLAMFDIHTIGSGGGSIASIDIGGALQVGPRSAGANPGPACYGRGGLLPTVTDANLVLGRLLPNGFLEGRMPLHRDRAEAAIAPLAGQMGKTIVETALGIIRIAESNMSAAIRHVTAGKGHDPRSFTLLSFGGAGGLHAAALADSLNIPRVLIPPHAGLLSALGMVVAPPLVDVSKTIANDPALSQREKLIEQFSALEQRSSEPLPDGLTARIERFADCRFRGQSYELTIALVDLSPNAIEQEFRRTYEATYGQCPQGREVEVVTLRVRRIGHAPRIRLPAIVPGKGELQSCQLILSSGELIEAPVVDRAGIAAAEVIAGPALLAESDSTAFIPLDWSARVTVGGSVILERI